MFSRKKTEVEDRKMADASDDLGIPLKPARPPVPGASAPVRTPTIPPRTPDVVRAAEPARMPEVTRRPGEAGGQPRQSEGDLRRLIVGREITL